MYVVTRLRQMSIYYTYVYHLLNIKTYTYEALGLIIHIHTYITCLNGKKKVFLVDFEHLYYSCSLEQHSELYMQLAV